MLILVIWQRYQFNTDDTKTEIIQFMKKEIYCPFMDSLWAYVKCSNLMVKNFFLSTICTGNKLLKTILKRKLN